MSRRRNSHAGTHENHERWLLTYADLITLLMIFFVVLYAMSKIDITRYEQLAISLNQSFYDGSTGVMRTKFEKSQGQPNEAGNSVDKQTLEASRKLAEETQRLKEAEQKLKQYIQQNNLGDKVMVELNERGVQITLRDVALYDTGSAVIKPEAERILDGIAPFLKALPNKISVEGHTDNVPIRNSQFRSNFDLSAARALNVLYYLQTREVKPDRLSATGYGEYMPVASNDTPEGRAANRRVNILILRSAVQ
ncbi:flagellar motor protein MotB [Effusibacillus pohliae]|uniref:flagellar motor protein MotB n=1 Tax=Effusibacillus pohliae TaxID=232270 RepID=UPI0003776FC7|nr:flagellar motor protein MotB [Effusibacillus pohliae]